MSQKAFTSRGIPGVRRLVTFIHSSKYKSRPFHEALQKALGNSVLFGGQHLRPGGYNIKVAVTSTNEEGERAVLIANYNRRDPKVASKEMASRKDYDFFRPNKPKKEFRVWEAAAATSAATPYFRPFNHRRSYQYFWDGAFYNNNPSEIVYREMKLLWPDMAERPPDIFLSLGTCQNKSDVDKHLPSQERRERREQR